MARIAVIGPGRSLLPAVVSELAREGHDAAAATDVFAGAEVVVNLAGVAAPTWLRDPAGGAIDLVDGTRTILGQADGAGVKSFVHVSSAAVYGAWPDNPVPMPEETPLRPNPGFAYARAHAEAERLLADWRDAHPDVEVAVLRPAIVMGGDGPSWMARAVGAVQAPRPREAARPLQFVHADDVASAVALVIDHHLEGAFNVAPDGWVPEETARALAGGVSRLTLPGWLVRPLGRIGWAIGRRGTPAEAIPWASNPWVIANDRLRAAGWEPAHPHEEAVVAAEPPGRLARLLTRRRQEVTLAAAGVVGAGLVTGVVLAIRRAHRR
jgi:nucleoside-diphosphate-sugar epimerase